MEGGFLGLSLVGAISYILDLVEYGAGPKGKG